MKHQDIIFNNQVISAIEKLLSKIGYNKLFILTDMNTNYFVLPKLKDSKVLSTAVNITIKSGDMNKNIDSVMQVWKQLQDNGATRKSVLINLGGGMVTDLGGFAASTFKRGIKFINVPTTLLGAVDAAVGGKTGFNFNGLKNEIGVFNEAVAVVISTCFFNSLPIEEIKSGYAEMLKHGLLNSEETFNKLIGYDFSNADDDKLLELLEESVNVKREIVRKDPHEKGIRRALNLGHTMGHAFESLAMKRLSPIPHGYAVAWGLIVDLILSNKRYNFDNATLERYVQYVHSNYGAFPISKEDYPQLIELMRHDKKSNSGEINFSLLKSVGEVEINCVVTESEVTEAMDIYCERMHLA